MRSCRPDFTRPCCSHVNRTGSSFSPTVRKGRGLGSASALCADENTPTQSLSRLQGAILAKQQRREPPPCLGMGATRSSYSDAQNPRTV